MANTFAEEYIKFRREADRANVRGAQELVQRALDKLAPSATDDRRELRRRARELEILASVQTGNAELVQSAQRPTSPSSPKIERNVALGILLGLFLGVGLTVLREQVNRRLRDPQEVEEAFDLPILGTIPESPALSMTSRDRNGSLDDDAEQAFLMLRASLRYISYFTVGDDEVRSIVVTSAAPRDGKTTVAWNLALAEARVGKLVLYVEADLRRPILAEQLGFPGRAGLASCSPAPRMATPPPNVCRVSTSCPPARCHSTPPS
jgi:polysaccharide biosynthesis transport protein